MGGIRKVPVLKHSQRREGDNKLETGCGINSFHSRQADSESKVMNLQVP